MEWFVVTWVSSFFFLLPSLFKAVCGDVTVELSLWRLDLWAAGWAGSDIGLGTRLGNGIG